MFKQKMCKNYTMNIAFTKTPLQILFLRLFALTLSFLFLLGSSIFLHIVQRMKAVYLGQNVLKKYSLNTFMMFLMQLTLQKSNCNPLVLFRASFSGAVGIFCEKFLSNMRKEKSKRLTLKLPLAMVFSRQAFLLKLSMNPKYWTSFAVSSSWKQKKYKKNIK